jgi:hypothetical protein
MATGPSAALVLVGGVAWQPGAWCDAVKGAICEPEGGRLQVLVRWPRPLEGGLDSRSPKNHNATVSACAWRRWRSGERRGWQVRWHDSVDGRGAHAGAKGGCSPSSVSRRQGGFRAARVEPGGRRSRRTARMQAVRCRGRGHRRGWQARRALGRGRRPRLAGLCPRRALGLEASRHDSYLCFGEG